MHKLLIYTLVLLLCGCSRMPEYQRPPVETPARWDTPVGGAAGFISHEWWRGFESPELNAAIARALNENLDLKAGVQRIEQSRAGLKIARAGLWPSIAASGGASRSRNDGPDNDPDYNTNLSAGLSVSYEVDLFGGNSALVDASRASLLNTQYTQESLRLVTIGDVARGYFTVLNNRERLRLNEDNLKNAREILRIVQARYDAGTISTLDLSQQKSALASAEAAHASLVQQESIAKNALALLLGKPPQGFEVGAQTLTNIKIPQIDPVQPSQLLERRPDIRAAEASLLTANANIGAARAAFFPSVGLGLNSGWSAAAFADPLSSAMSLAASLAAPIFQGGRLEGGLDQATARQKELVENYRKAVLTAFREVEDALTAVNISKIREEKLQEAMKEARTSYMLSQTLYDAGSIDFQVLLNTQTTYFNAQDSYVQARFARLSAAIDLFKALGGGWQG
ncbi:MAG: TolC family protein [Alphaproteobacteria bacterium]|nr:TolC family protein [Alphaproteobacteria bacterium]